MTNKEKRFCIEMDNYLTKADANRLMKEIQKLAKKMNVKVKLVVSELVN